MINLLIAFFISFSLCYVIIRLNSFKKFAIADDRFHEPQKIHSNIVPRVGGLALIFAIAIPHLIVVHFQDGYHPSDIHLKILLSSLPIFMIGLAEDLTKKISIKIRLIAATISASLAIYLLDLNIRQLDMSITDILLSISIVSLAFTCFSLVGLINAYNIIDGANGLASMVAIITLISLSYVGYSVGDQLILSMSLVILGALLGFFLWNYPKGHIFLGDCGAYLIGFYIAVLTIFFICRNPEISPWYGLIINLYPVFEAVFSIWRKKILQGKSPGTADAAHLHSLIYKRITRKTKKKLDRQKYYYANAKTSQYLWFLVCAIAIPGTFLWENSTALKLITLIYIFTYIYLYFSIVKFKVPKIFL